MRKFILAVITSLFLLWSFTNASDWFVVEEQVGFNDNTKRLTEMVVWKKDLSFAVHVKRISKVYDNQWWYRFVTCEYWDSVLWKDINFIPGYSSENKITSWIIPAKWMDCEWEAQIITSETAKSLYPQFANYWKIEVVTQSPKITSSITETNTVVKEEVKVVEEKTIVYSDRAEKVKKLLLNTSKEKLQALKSLLLEVIEIIDALLLK